MTMTSGRRVTMHQVAVEAGVSVSTVSKVINGRYGISEETSSHVTAVIERLGYETSLVARSLRNQRTGVVGVLVADFEPFSTEVLKGAADAIRETEYELVAYSAGGHVDERVGWERRYVSRVMGTLVDGAVLVTPTVTEVDSDGPLVAIDPHTGSTSMPTITAHNLQGARAGVEHLLGLGHTRIGMILGRSDLVSAQRREQGFRDAMADAGLEVDESMLVSRRVRARRRARRGARAAGAGRPAHRRLRRQRLLGDRGARRRGRAGHRRPPRPLGGRLRQPRRVGPRRAAAHHRRAARARDGPHRRRHAHRPRRGTTARRPPPHPGHPAGGTPVDPGTPRRRPVTDHETWRDPSATVAERVDDLVARMTTAEKLGQLASVWLVTSEAGEMAPMQQAGTGASWPEAIADGLGQLTRPFGTAPVDVEQGLADLERQQAEVRAANRFGIPAQVHEECLTGLNAWRATIYPTPLGWAATFDPDLVERMARQVGEVMGRLGIHQGLAPVLDVVRDLRWGRVEESLGEDPHLVGTMASAYVRGLQSEGVVATLKHFLGYSASRGGRNLAPVSMGSRELADVILPPFEMALRAGARSVMNSYSDIDGIPSAADPALLTGLLRDELGFEGTVVADYFSVAFLHALHGVAADPGEAAHLALAAGIDVELPSVDAYGESLLEAVTAGRVDEKLVDRALMRVLRQKCELGLLDPDWAPAAVGPVDLDPPEARDLARDLARRGIVLLANDGVLPLAEGRRLAVVGPNADAAQALLGCYTFPMHVLVHHPGHEAEVAIPTVREALAATYDVVHAVGCAALPGDPEPEGGLDAAVEAAAAADVCVAVLGDRAGLFGRGTSGEGCDVPDLRLPGRQEELLERLLATGTPVVAVLLVGRPYDLSRQVDRLAAVVCGFFPGEEGATAVADVLTGRVDPSGRLPVSFPGAGSTQPSTYLASPLAQRSEVSSVDPTPLFPFGHGLGYAAATWRDVALTSGPTWATDGVAEVAVDLANDTDRTVTEVVQVYLHDPVASVVRPVQRLVASARVELPPGHGRRVCLGLHADLTSFTGRDQARLVEPGAVELRVGRSSADYEAVLELELVGSERSVGPERVLEPTVVVDDIPSTTGDPQ